MAYPDEDTPLLLLLVLATRRLTDVLQEHLVVAGFHDHRVVHHHVMAHMTHHGSRVTDLADRAGISKQAMSQMVDDLERLGYLQRTPDPHDGRAKLVRFAPRGRAAVDAAGRAFDEMEAAFTDRTGPDELRRLRRHLLALLDAPAAPPSGGPGRNPQDMQT